MTYIDIVNDNDEIIGKTSLSEAHEKGLCHRCAVVYLENYKKEILIQERMDDGKLDHSAAGHVDLGESYEDAATRELAEELGVKDVKLRYIGGVRTKHHFFQVYITKSEPGHLQKDEVKSVFWADPRKVAEDMRVHPGKYSSGFIASIQLIFSLTGR